MFHHTTLGLEETVVLISMLMGALVGFLTGLIGWLGFGLGFGTAVALYFGLSFLGAAIGVLASLAHGETAPRKADSPVLPSTANSF